jgi:fructokinase
VDTNAIPTARPAIGIDLGGTKIEAVVLAPDGSESWRERVPTPAGDYAATLAAVAALVARAETDLRLTGCSVGVGGPGTLTAAGRVKNANSTCLNGEPLERDLARVLGRPVRYANDANCLALSESHDGAAAGAEVAFCVILGTGVGAGITVHGALLTGPNGVAGEWGHNPLPWAGADEWPGPPCYCGQRGCIETWVSGPALARDHAEHGGDALDAAQIGALAAHGNPTCAATLARHASRLARGLAHVINVLDPDVIVLAGGVSLLDGLAHDVVRMWGEFVFASGPGEPVRTRLVRSRHGDSSGVRGAARLGAVR